MNNEKIAEAEDDKAADGRITGADKRGILENLEKYCGLDTMGMVEILRVLREMADK